MLILGINAFHADSSAAVIRDGELIAAAEEERFCRVKHWAGVPVSAIGYCLKEAGVRISEIDHIAVNQDSRANFFRKIAYLVSNRPSADLVWRRLRNRKARSNLKSLLTKSFGEKIAAPLHHVEHHLAHLSSAFHVSPFDRAAVVSVDGFGDFSSAAWGFAVDREISVLGRVYFPHSLGIFYQAVTQFLGFPHYGDEYKVMGLAPYGEPIYLREMREIVHLTSDGGYRLNLRYFCHHNEDVPTQWNNGIPEFGELFSNELEMLLGPRRNSAEPLEQRHWDIARSAQAMYEEAFFHMLNVLQQKTGATNLALAGGCGMNSVANGKVRRMTPFRRLYVQSAAGDAGGAIGAAFAVWHQLGGARRFVMDHAYWGPQYSAAEVGKAVEARREKILEDGCELMEISDEDRLCSRVAEAISEGKVVGWFQGRMEWGPRALGNRSILCDPRRADMKHILNEKIKRRESFRPFAPSVLQDAVSEWFEEDDAVPFMMQVFQIKKDKRALIPAVTHVDGSGRLQTVSQGANPRYYRLIEKFAEITGIPMLLNTSFNENEPVVCTPAEALDCFLRTKMDLLVMGDTLLVRQPQHSAANTTRATHHK